MTDVKITHPPSVADSTPLIFHGEQISRSDALQILGEGSLEEFVEYIQKAATAINASDNSSSDVQLINKPDAILGVRPASSASYRSAVPQRKAAESDFPQISLPTTTAKALPATTTLLTESLPEFVDRRSADADVSGRPPPKRRRIHIPPPTVVHVEMEHSLDFEVPDYASYNADQRTLALNNMERSAIRMFSNYPHIPEVKVVQDISPTYLRRLFIQIHNRSLATQSESWAQRARVVLLFGFCVLEVGMNWLGFGEKFAEKVANGRFMSNFDEELSTIGDMLTVNTGGKKWGNPYMRIAMYTGINVVFVMGIKLLSWIMPKQAAEGFLDFLINTFFGAGPPPAARQSPSSTGPTRQGVPPRRTYGTDAPEGASPTTTSFMGISASTFMTSAASAIGNLVNGGAAQSMGMGTGKGGGNTSTSWPAKGSPMTF
jgi:hypothetical protein